MSLLNVALHQKHFNTHKSATIGQAERLWFVAYIFRQIVDPEYLMFTWEIVEDASTEYGSTKPFKSKIIMHNLCYIQNKNKDKKSINVSHRLYQTYTPLVIEKHKLSSGQPYIRRQTPHRRFVANPGILFLSTPSLTCKSDIRRSIITHSIHCLKRKSVDGNITGRWINAETVTKQ